MPLVSRQFLRLFSLLAVAAFLGFCTEALVGQGFVWWGWTLAMGLLFVLLALLARAEAMRIDTPLRSLGMQDGDLDQLPRIWAELERERGDLRAHAQREDALRRELLARLREGVILLDPQRSVRLFNPAAQELLGPRLPFAQGASLQVLFREPEALSQIQRAFQGQESEWTQVRGHRRLRIRALPLGFGDHSGVLLTLDDITSQEQLETTRQKFISNVSHELKTPLTALRVAAENLQAGPLDEDGHLAVASLLRSVDRMTLLIQDLAELSRIESGALTLDSQDVRLGPFTEQVAGDLDPLARSRGVRVRLDLDGVGDRTFRADPLRLHQVLENLVGNAVKFSPSGAEVVIRLRAEAGRARWEIQDAGPGIPEADQGRVFERFYRSAATRAVPGTGLGLAIVKHLVRLMGGEVGFDSKVGKGTTFWVELPGHSSVWSLEA
jgi:two-component system phosphate regulon sensor histidine kinase PhoR